MIVEIVALIIFWLNMLKIPPPVGGNPSPRHIIAGLTIDYKKHCRLNKPPGTFPYSPPETPKENNSS